MFYCILAQNDGCNLNNMASRPIVDSELSSFTFFNLLKIALPNAILNSSYSRILIYHTKFGIEFCFVNATGILEQHILLNKKYQKYHTIKENTAISGFFARYYIDGLENYELDYILVDQNHQYHYCPSTYYKTVKSCAKLQNLLTNLDVNINFLEELKPDTKFMRDMFLKKEILTKRTNSNLSKILNTLGNPHFTHTDSSGKLWLFFFGSHDNKNNTCIGYVVIELDAYNSICRVIKNIPCSSSCGNSSTAPILTDESNSYC